MIILGISITHDGTLTVLKDGINYFSIAEERLNRQKAYIGFPFKSLKYVISEGIIIPSEVEKVAVSSSVFLKEWAFTYAFELTENKKYYDIQNDKLPDDFFIDDKGYLDIKSDEDCKKYVYKKVRNLLDAVGINAEIEFVEHHTCHASSAYFSSGLNKALVITLDGEGDLLSATVSVGNDRKIERISETSNKNSAGYLYSEVTKQCGFKISRHEGKITGLAAYGDYKKSEKCYDSITSVVDGKLEYQNRVEPTVANRVKSILLNTIGLDYKIGVSELINRCGKLSNEDLSAAIQNHLEKRIVEIVTYWINKTGITDVVLAGGIFANVKFNQYISEIEDLKSIYIFPDMGDGGNAYGAAANLYYKANEYIPFVARTKNMYYGPEFDNEYVLKLLDKHSNEVKFYKSENISKDTAQLIANNKIIGWFQGRMEYGPRALGNRSIVASPTDRDINKWLNERMKRTEFMPFAPSCIYEMADELFELPGEFAKFPAQFMTITFKMHEEWVKKAPAVAHVDGTARPQLVTKEANPKFYDMLQEYYKITGLPLVINTSFNVHEEPIVCKPEEGLKSLLTSVVDVFVCQDYIIELK